MRAGVAASRKLKAKTDDPVKSRNSSGRGKQESNQRRSNARNCVVVNKGGSVKTYALQSSRHHVSNVTSQHAFKRCSSDKDRAVTSLEVGVSCLITGNGGALSAPPSAGQGFQGQKNSGYRNESARNFSAEDFNKPSSLDALNKMTKTAEAFASAGVTSKGQAQYNNARKQYYRKAIGLMVVGGLIFATGVTLAALYFAGYATVQIAGPICLALGLLLTVCGLVWIPIIKTRLKIKQQMMSRTFNS